MQREEGSWCHCANNEKGYYAYYAVGQELISSLKSQWRIIIFGEIQWKKAKEAITINTCLLSVHYIFISVPNTKI